MKISNTKRKWGAILLFLAIIIGMAFYPSKPQAPIQYYERETGELRTEKVAGENWLVWLYYNPVGEATLWAFAKRKLVSAVYGKIMDCTCSAKKIAPFVKDFDIDLSIAQEQEFDNFNDFFTRKLKDGARLVNTDSSIVVSPADGKILAYANINNSDFIIKGGRFDVASFLNNTELAQKYHNGDLLIIRLAPPDYHRFHFPLGGNILLSEQIDGDYYSVNPIALRKKVEIFFMNKREYTILSNPLFGDVVMAEVGATMVGSIVQTYENTSVNKGDEKGYFKFGGSTVVLLFEKNQITIDKDLLRNTAEGYETTVEMGEKIGILTFETYNQPKNHNILPKHDKR